MLIVIITIINRTWIPVAVCYPVINSETCETTGKRPTAPTYDR